MGLIGVTRGQVYLVNAFSLSLPAFLRVLWHLLQSIYTKGHRGQVSDSRQVRVRGRLHHQVSKTNLWATLSHLDLVKLNEQYE